LGSDTAQDHRRLFCGICRLFQDMDRGSHTEEADREVYLRHLWIEHGVVLAKGEVLTR
jgi:hypothetical protein